jgi:hypothetical protein
MKTDVGQLIDELCSDVQPVVRIWHPLVRSALWIPSVLVGVFLAFYFADAFRESSIHAVLTSPRFFLECALGIVAGLVAAIAMFESMVPGIRWTAGKKLLVLAPTIIFILVISYGFIDPTLKPSWAGWRETCEAEIFLAGAFPILICFWLGIRSAPLDGGWTGGLAVIASCSPAIVAMNLACMYSPGHILFFHILPVCMASIAIGLVGRAVFRLK